MRNILLVLLLWLALFSSCSAKTYAKSGDSAVQENKEVVVEKKGDQDAAQIDKLGRVLSSMSDKAKATIPNGDPREFLADLKLVLDSEKDFAQDDLSPFYLIDKKHNVGPTYAPKHLKTLVKNSLYDISRADLSLREDVEAALCVMAQAALKDGIRLEVISSYRSYEYQKKLFAKWVALDGLAEAEREIAREGTSQHQLGSAIDFGSLSDSFVKTPMGAWLNKYAWEYGWSLSFPQGYEDVTGFRWECWHFRYIGKEACRFQKKWFGDVQQFMIEFIDAWKNME